MADDLSAAPAVAAPQASPQIRVLVVDDSAIVRGLITRQLAADPALTVIGSAPHGEAALAELARRPADVVVLDIEMPVMNGLTALPLILAAHPNIKVVMASSLTRRNAEISLKALQLGASDYVAKPSGSLGAADEFMRDLIAKVKALAPKRSQSPPLPTTHRPDPIVSSALAAYGAAAGAPRTARRAAPRVLAIGASTGGPPALLKLFEGLRGAIEQPIFLTQHMPATFTALLAEQLARAGDRPCSEGVDGVLVRAGHCYVAPGGWHMTVRQGADGPTIRLDQEPPENYCRPAVDPMFRSLASVYGAGVVGVVLTGMGADGAKGCASIAAAGGRFIVQDEATSIVWGMPGAAAETGLAERILPLADIAPWLRLSLAVAG